LIHTDYIRLNRIFAGVALAISFLVYLLTMADTVPYWDSGEFIATSYILGVPHPPGSPLYLIIGRVFSMIPFNPDIAFRVNLISPLVSALAVMYLYLSTVKLISNYRGKIQTQMDAIITFGGSLVGAFTFAFTDSHWFNAVEAEVYGFSTFFTAIVVWLIFHWAERADEKGNERYILIIAYMIGLATGVHLLNLLALPFIALIIYFRKYKFSYKGFLITTAITGVVYLVINVGIINGTPKLVDSIGLNLVIILSLAITGAMIATIVMKKFQYALALTSIVLILIGYSSYATIFIRSGQEPAINENDPSTVARAIAYMEREQYGQMFQFPRRYDGLPPKHEIPAVGRPANGQKYTSAQERKYKTYRMDKQWGYFWSYQVKKMYWRYFLWQFAGRGSSTEKYVTAYGANAKEDGVDWFQFGLPLAFLFGLWGMFYHFQRDREQAFSVFALFLMMGLAIIIFVNQDNPQPRERDYSYVGSFFAFSMWISIAVAAMGDKLRQIFKDKPAAKNAIISTMALLLVVMPGVMLKANYHEHDRSDNRLAWDYSYNILQSCEPNAILFTNGDNDTFPLWYLQEVEGIRKDVTVANLSLLNTEWYIRQLRDSRRGQVDQDGRELERFINMTDVQIMDVASGLQPWKARNVQIPTQKSDKNKDGFIQWKVNPTFAGAALMVKDMMILKIISDARWKYPIYFAVTVPGSNRLDLDPFLEMEGLVYRVRDYKVNPRNPISEERMWTNLMSGHGSDVWEKDIEAREWKKLEGEIWSKEYQPGYLFRNLGRDDVYYFPTTNIRLLQNLRSAYMQLAAFHYMAFKDNENSDQEKAGYHRSRALAVMAKMQDNIPEKTIRYDSKDLYYQVGRLFGELGDKDELRRIVDNLMTREDIDIRDRLDFGQVYISQLNSFEIGRTIFEELYADFKAVENGDRRITQREMEEWRKNFTQIVSSLVYTYKQLDMKPEAEVILADWLDKNPNDPVAQKLLEDLKKEEGKSKK
jgi:hypothetical protein|tara:strand:+ start:22962 stop:25922 length:2961 start_codon:yes stop_codon:yes gene_type:complete